MRYRTCCVALQPSKVPALDAMTENAKDITYATMRRNCPDLPEWARRHGYDRWLPLSKDWHVSYHKSTFEGAPCYYLVWSAIENIWT